MTARLFEGRNMTMLKKLIDNTVSIHPELNVSANISHVELVLCLGKI